MEWSLLKGEERYLSSGATGQGRVILVRLMQLYYLVMTMDKKQPIFETEAQEAQWWAANQDFIAERFEDAKAKGNLGKGTVSQVASGPRVEERRRL